MSFTKLWISLREINHLMQGSEFHAQTSKPKFGWFASSLEKAQWVEIELILRNYDLKDCNLATGVMTLVPKRIKTLKDRIAERIAQKALSGRLSGVSNAMTPVPKDSPINIAWEAYKSAPHYSVTRHWAKHEEHVDGSLWAAFSHGFDTATRLAKEAQDVAAQTP